MFKIVVEERKNSDETLSYEGTKDFVQPDGEVKTLQTKLPLPRPRTKASQNNSYT